MTHFFLRILGFSSIVTILSLSNSHADKELSSKKDHVLLITVDDLNDWIGVLGGHPQASTPNLDALAKRGVLFTNAHCQSPVCVPSRTSFMSGLRPSTTGVYSNDGKQNVIGELEAGKDVPWLPIRFQKAGYTTYAVGKVLHSDPATRVLSSVRAPSTDYGPLPKEKLNIPSAIAPLKLLDYGIFPETEDEFIDLNSAKWMSQQILKPLKENENRFLSLGIYRPHMPVFAPAKWFHAAPKLQDIILAQNMKGDEEDLPEIARRNLNKHAKFSISMIEEPRLRELTQAYLACTSAMDDCIGQVIQALDQSPMAGNTWIVVLSDHGWHLGEKNHIAKGTLWERSTRVPLIIVPPTRNKDAQRGVSCDRPVELLDVYPTLIEGAALAADHSTDKHLQGLSLMPLLINPTAPREKPALTTYYPYNHALRDERYRYIRYADGSEELYDHANDPNEHHNLLFEKKDDSTLNAVVTRLSQWLPKVQVGEPELFERKSK